MKLRIFLCTIACLATMLHPFRVNADPSNVGSTHQVGTIASYLVYQSRRAAQVDGEFHYGTQANHHLGTVVFHCSWTLIFKLGSHNYEGRTMEQLCWTRNSRTLRSLFYEGSLRDGRAGSVLGGNDLQDCGDLGSWSGYEAVPANERKTSQLCAQYDERALHHNMVFWFRFQLERVPGFYWICHVRSVVATKTFGKRYYFEEASHIAGRNDPQDHVLCYRNSEGGGGGLGG